MSQDELGNFLDNFKTKILGNLTEQVEILRMQKYKKYNVDICVIHTESHATKYCPSLPRFKELYQEESGASQSPKKLCYVAPRGPRQPSQPGMMQGPNSKFQGMHIHLK